MRWPRWQMPTPIANIEDCAQWPENVGIFRKLHCSAAAKSFDTQLKIARSHYHKDTNRLVTKHHNKCYQKAPSPLHIYRNFNTERKTNMCMNAEINVAWMFCFCADFSSWDENYIPMLQGLNPVPVRRGFWPPLMFFGNISKHFTKGFWNNLTFSETQLGTFDSSFEIISLVGAKLWFGI